MKEKLVSLKLAKLALRKGFDYPTHYYVWTDRDYIQSMCNSNKPSELHRQMLFTEDIDKKKRVFVYYFCSNSKSFAKMVKGST